MKQRHSYIAIFVALSLCMTMPPADAGIVRFLTGPTEGEPVEIAMQYILNHRQALGLSEADLADITVQDRYTTRHNGVTHIYFQQRLDGIEIYNGLLNLNVARDGSIINLGNNFVSNLAAKVNTNNPALLQRAAIISVASHLGLRPPSDLILLSDDGGPERQSIFIGSSISREEIPIRLVYQPLEDGQVRLAWETRLDTPGNPDTWTVRADAATGDVIGQFNHTSYDTYRVIPFPHFSDPEDSGGQTDVVDPHELGTIDASPFGWHDTDGVDGAESTLTRGNNVNAQEDVDANNTGGFSPDGGASLEFQFDFDPAETPTGGTNQEAAIVNLFYGINVMHDLMYQYGFDEASGNFQVNNYGNGGAGGDQVEADAQDGSGTNYFKTFADGIPARMECSCVRDKDKIVVYSPPTIAGDYVAASGGWGGELMPPITGDLEIVDDGSVTPTQACNPLIGFTTGNIALIDRGACEFGLKAQNAQVAGATAAIIINDQQLPNGLVTMGAGMYGAGVGIPTVMIGNTDGFIIRDKTPTVNATLKERPITIDRDSDLDNGIIAHEYGHGISARLTGGPGNVGCLAGSEQPTEGWSDFWALTLTAKDSDTLKLARGFANYVSFQPVNGPGVRNFPYTTDLTLNPQTYEDIGSTNVPHGVGEIWASMLWEVHWEMVKKWGFDTDLYNGTGGNNRTIQLVLDGMKMQPCEPDFVEARDAILMADQVNYGGENACELWRAFAKRGLGFNADSGIADGGVGVGDEVEDFTLPAECLFAPEIFLDGFESGDTSAWTSTIPLSFQEMTPPEGGLREHISSRTTTFPKTEKLFCGGGFPTGFKRDTPNI